MIGQHLGGAQLAGDVEVVAARVHGVLLDAVAVLHHLGGGVRQAGLLLDGQAVEVGAEQYGGAFTVLENPHHAATDLVGRVAELVELAGDLREGLGLQHGQFGVLVELLVQRFLPLVGGLHCFVERCVGSSHGEFSCCCV